MLGETLNAGGKLNWPAGANALRVTTALLTPQDVAEQVKVSADTVKRAYRAGKLRGYQLTNKLIRFDQQQVNDWVASTLRKLPDSPPLSSYPLLRRRDTSASSQPMRDPSGRG
jgi:excisionase family DNA binding protein